MTEFKVQTQVSQEPSPTLYPICHGSYGTLQNMLEFWSVLAWQTFSHCLHWGSEIMTKNLPNSWGNSSHKIAIDVLIPWSRESVKEAPMASPSMKLCKASLKVIIQAIVPISDNEGPLKQLHELLWVSSFWRNEKETHLGYTKLWEEADSFHLNF